MGRRYGVSLSRFAVREARRALAASSCDHEWNETGRTRMPDGRFYLTKRCSRCGAEKLRGTGVKGSSY